MEIGRPAKETPLESIQYEIDFLRLALNRLYGGPMPENPDRSFLIEVALIHYRNLIQFFTNDGEKNKSDLLNVSRPEEWAGRSLTPAERERLRQTQTVGKPLKDEYWRPISLYLQHLGKIRTTDRGWDLPEMYSALERALVVFEEIFPRASGTGPVWVVTGSFTQGVFHTKAFESPVKVIKPEE